MTKERNNQNLTHWFTLIEMVIVLIIMGIMLMFTLSLSWQQIQKVKDKAVKEAILTEMQTRYSRNLWSSSFAWNMYSSMDVTMKQWENKIDFVYHWNKKDKENIQNTFMDHFEIKYITFDANNEKPHGESTLNINLSFWLRYCSPLRVYQSVYNFFV